MMAKMGIKVTPELDLDTMHGQRLDAVKQLTGGIAFLFKKNKVDVAQGPRHVRGCAYRERRRATR
jgi:dihydrolipoamide dehydrogenase (EC 1.8.1.4)